MRIAYLACSLTLPDSAERRPDAFEHDQMMECFSAGFAAQNGSVDAVQWDAADVDWSVYDAVLIGSTWDYQDALPRFLDRLSAIERSSRLFNSSAIVRWNSRKTYLKDLAAKRVPIIPTLWLDDPREEEIAAAFDQLASDDLVLKRQIGANAEGQLRLKRGDAVPTLTHPMMVQPFLPAIQTEGELSMIFIDGHFSHGLIKTAAAGDYRIQSSYGGSERRYLPSDSDISAAKTALDALDTVPLYARVDLARDQRGQLALMELELIEPFLYPRQADDLGERIYQALARRLNTM